MAPVGSNHGSSESFNPFKLVETGGYLVKADIINHIESWVDAGLSPKAIAEKIGCTLGTLKVRPASSA